MGNESSPGASDVSISKVLPPKPNLPVSPIEKLILPNWLKSDVVSERKQLVSDEVKDRLLQLIPGFDEPHLSYHIDETLFLSESLRQTVNIKSLFDDEMTIPIGHYLREDDADAQAPDSGFAMRPIVGFQADRAIPVYAKVSDLSEYLAESVTPIYAGIDSGKITLYQNDVTKGRPRLVEVDATDRTRLTRDFSTDSRDKAIREAVKLRLILRDSLKKFADERKMDVRALVKQWTWNNAEITLHPPMDNFLERTALIDNAVAWFFERAFTMSHNEFADREQLSKLRTWLSHHIIDYAQGKLMSGAFALKNLVLTDFADRLENWWEEVEMEYGSPYIKTGIGGWISQWHLSEYFKAWRNKYDKDHGEEYLTKLTESLVYGAAQSLDEPVRTRRFFRKNHKERYAVVWRNRIPYRIDLSDITPESIHTQVAAALSADPSSMPGYTKQFEYMHSDALSIILAKLNNELPKHRVRVLHRLLNEIGFTGGQRRNLHHRISSFIELLEGAEYSVSIGDHPYTESTIGLFNAGMCSQTMQFHIDDRKIAQGEVGECFVYNPHWNYDVKGSLVKMKEVIAQAARYMPTQLESEGKADSKVLSSPGMNKIKSSTAHPHAYGTIVKDLFDAWRVVPDEKRRKVLASFDGFERRRADGEALEEAAARLNRYALDRLLSGSVSGLDEPHRRRTAGAISLIDMINGIYPGRYKLDRLAELAHLNPSQRIQAEQLIGKMSDPHVVTPFQLLALSHMFVRRDRGDIGALMFPVDRGVKRLGVGACGMNAITYEHLKSVRNTMEEADFIEGVLKDQIPKGENGVIAIDAWVDEAANKLTKLNNATVGDGRTILEYIFDEEVRPIMQEVSRAQEGNSALMVVATGAGSRAMRNIFATAAEVIGAKNEAKLARLIAQLSFVPANKLQEWGIVRGDVHPAQEEQSGEVISQELARCVGFTGAGNDPLNTDEIVAGIAIPTQKGNAEYMLSVRVPGDHANEEIDAKSFMDNFGRAIGLVSTLGMSYGEWRKVLHEYVQECLRYMPLIDIDPGKFIDKEGKISFSIPLADYLRYRMGWTDPMLTPYEKTQQTLL